MREILFRGKRIDNGEWVHGDLVHAENKSYISYYYESPLSTFINEQIEYVDMSMVGVAPFIEVDLTTIGQYTGLTDKNGKKVFEGDILKVIHFFRGSMDEFKKKKIRKAYGKAIENKKSYLEEFTYFRNYAVEYSVKKYAWIGRNGSDQHELKSLTNRFHKGAVIGNIHDNPELLEVDK